MDLPARDHTTNSARGKGYQANVSQSRRSYLGLKRTATSLLYIYRLPFVVVRTNIS